MKKEISKKILTELIRVDRKYWTTGDVDILAKKSELAKVLAQQYYYRGQYNIFGSISYGDLVSSYNQLGLTYEEIYKQFEGLGFVLLEEVSAS